MRERWDTLDILKCLCAFGVVTIHRGFPGPAGVRLRLLFRFAVPVFFMITGFFFRDTLERGREKGQIRKIFRLMVGANLFFFLLGLFLVLQKRKGVEGVVLRCTQYFSWEKLRDFFLANESPFKSHLWYLGAILYVLLLASYLAKKKRLWILGALTPLLLAGDLAFGKYSLLLWNQEISYIYVRNYLFVGLPFFYMGYWLGCRREWIQRKMNPFLMFLLFVGSLLFFGTSLLEKRYLVSRGINASREQYISTTLMALCVFLFFVGWKKYYGGGWVSRFFAAIGRRYSTWIYILHPGVITAYGLIFARKEGALYELYSRCMPLVLFVTTTVLAALIQLFLELSRRRGAKP